MRLLCAGLLVLLSAAVAVADYQRLPISFYHEDYSVKELAELREKYDFDEYVASGKTELERMYLLQDWVYSHVAYGGAPEFIDLRDSLTILDMASEGEEFWCNNLAAVFMQCAVSLGWTSRYIFLRSPEGDSHVSNDIWSNELRKWIMLDATWNLHLERDGEPLSIPEIREVWSRKSMAELDYVFGAGGHERRYTVADMPIERDDSKLWHWWPVDEKWISFTHAVAYVMRNDFFSIGNGNGGSIWSGIVTVRDTTGANVNDRYWEFREKPDARSMRALYHDVNRVDVRVVPAYAPGASGASSDGRRGLVATVARLLRRSPAPSVALWLDAYGTDNYTPNLATFLVQVNGGTWTESGAGFAFEPVEGVNRISARVVNRFGVLGPITEVDLAWRAGAEPALLYPLSAWAAGGLPH